MKYLNMKALSGALLVTGLFTSVSFGAAQNNEAVERARGAQAFNDVIANVLAVGVKNLPALAPVMVKMQIQGEFDHDVIESKVMPNVRRAIDVATDRIEEIGRKESDAFKAGFYTEPLRQGCRRVASDSQDGIQLHFPPAICERFARPELTRTPAGFNCIAKAARECPVQDFGVNGSGVERTGMCLMGHLFACADAASKK